MKANELIIGDWVYDTILKVYTKVELLSVSGIRGDFHESVYNENTFEPIPLTPEILEKNGFETEDDVHFSIQGQSSMLELLLVELPFDGYYFDIVRTEKTINKCNQRCYIDRYFASIDYVHQLQHALRLCGIEKTIEL
jgi:hypothetical protein